MKFLDVHFRSGTVQNDFDSIVYITNMNNGTNGHKIIYAILFHQRF